MRLLGWPVKVVLLLFVTALIFIIYRTLRSRSPATRYKVARAMAVATYKIRWGLRNRIKRNLSLVRPDLQGEELEAKAKEVVDTIAREWAVLLGSEDADVCEAAQRIDVEGAEKILRRLECTGQNVTALNVIIAPIHLCSIEGVLDCLDIFQVPTYAPIERINPEYLLRLSLRLRGGHEFLRLEPRQRGQTYRRMVERFRCGWAIAPLVDIQAKKSGVLCRIGNGQGRFETGAVRLALEEDGTIFPAFVVRQDGQYKVVVEDSLELVKTGDREADIEINTRWLIEGRVAPRIQSCPGQWMRAPWADLEPVGKY